MELQSVDEEVLMESFDNLIQKLLFDELHQNDYDNYETSWEIEKILCCRYKNNKDIFNLRLAGFKKGWREKLLKQFQQLYFITETYSENNPIEIIELQVSGELKESLIFE